ncbi:uncharacterized protein LOC117793775 [Drosophila innubila]|uniref:uncharacterized protein LOC117793775 n=1 Tax=Drosophila innubila TaxID=198719 RepID=UPI00148C8A83|nr:uncharacterized protein LOC117793775 [Drosophila innubila]
MQPNEHLKKVMKILIFAFLCTEMRTSYTHRELTKQRGIGASSSAEKRRHSQAPYQASIRLIDQELDYFGKGHICSGALVGPSVVITVGQCLYNNASKSYYHPAELRVLLGSTQRFAPTAHSQVYGVTHVYQPPKDLLLAILMLDQDVPQDQPYIQSIPLPVEGISLDQATEQIPAPASCQVSSWGLAGDEGQELHDMVTLRVDCLKPTQRCEIPEMLAKYSSYELDAGAPLTKSNQLIALSSESSAIPESTFVDVARHVDWIHAKIGDGTTQNSSIWGVLGLLVFTAYVIKCSSKSLLS